MYNLNRFDNFSVSTRSRPKAAGRFFDFAFGLFAVSTRSRPKAAGLNVYNMTPWRIWFQHAAARRRLATVEPYFR